MRTVFVRYRREEAAQRAPKTGVTRGLGPKSRAVIPAEIDQTGFRGLIVAHSTPHLAGQPLGVVRAPLTRPAGLLTTVSIDGYTPARRSVQSRRRHDLVATGEILPGLPASGVN
jgi:hypothetical protein